MGAEKDLIELESAESVAESLNCALEPDGLHTQLDRYRRLGAAVRSTARAPQRLSVEFNEEVDRELLEQTLAIERECCPFFSLSYDPQARRLEARVAKPEHDPGLDALLAALGADATPP